MKSILRLSIVLLIAATATAAHANFFDDIKGDLINAPTGESPKYTALYYSAQWCPPCRAFTPKLVEWYTKFKAKHPNFDLVFVSGDRDEASMQKYIKEDKMPWLAVAFDKRQNEIFEKHSSQGIPYLVLIGEDGKALTAKPNNEWQSPMGVLTQIEKIVGGAN